VIEYKLEQAHGQLHFLISLLVYMSSAVVVIAILLQVNPFSAFKVAALHLATLFGVTVALSVGVFTAVYALKTEEPVAPSVHYGEISANQDRFVQQRALPSTMPYSPPWVTAEIAPSNNQP
jgi:hypothetical protein